MEFQAVLLAAGRGTRLSPLTDHLPKCLLPIGNLPMLWYPLKSLEQAGIQEVIILVLEGWRDKVRQSLEQASASLKYHQSFSYYSIPDHDDEGTASSLLRIADKVKKDLLVISCDVITNDRFIRLLAKEYRLKDATCVSLMKKQIKPEGPIPGTKGKAGKVVNFVGLDELDNRILFLGSEADYDEFIPLSSTVLQRHPCVNIYTDLQDCHLYVLSKSTIPVLKEKNFSSIQSELLPTLVENQFTFANNFHTGDRVQEVAKNILSADLVSQLSSWNDHTGDLDDPYHGSKEHCFTCLANDGLCIRANTVADYYEANKLIVKHGSDFSLSELHKLPKGIKRSQAGPDSLVCACIKLGEKCAIKKSVVGKNCIIGDRVKVTNCVIMDNVEIKEGCVLQNSIICCDVVINEKAELKECIVGAKEQVDASTKLAHDVLANIEDI